MMFAVPDEKRTKIGPTGPVRARSSAVPATPVMPSPPPAASPAAVVGTAPPEAVTPILPTVTSYLPPKADPLLGQVLAGRYLIQKKLGEGGMGAVYLATHNVLEKQVALKVLHGEFARKADLVERFMQEAKSASRIRHENVIDISDFGSTPEGMVFFAMELLKGRDLHEEIARARLAGQLLPWERTKKIFLQICSALSAAHAIGIVHRDLKPENIYLVEFLGEPDFVKLLDFGIAKLTDVNEGDRKLTRTGMLFGTPEYMSPEQARGDTVDARVDVYAMGCILFQMVTGRVPFEADNFMSVLSLHLVEPPPVIPPDVFDSIGAPRTLAAVIDRALVKDRNQRFGSIDELAAAVRRASGDKLTGPVVARPSVPAPASASMVGRVRTHWSGHPSVPEAEPPPRKSKLPMIVGAVALVAAAAIAAAVAVSRDPEAPAPVAASVAAPGSQAVPPGTPAAAPPSAPPPAGPATVSAPPPAPAAPTTPGATAVASEGRPSAPAAPSLGFERAEIRIASVPPAAEVRDAATNKVIGYTPLVFDVPPSRTPRQFTLRLKNHYAATIDVTPNRAKLEYTERLNPMPGVATGEVPVPPPRPPAEDPCEEPPCLKPDPSRPASGGSATP
jgi:eukaryotic-like serine/threonine-protein kinase